MGVTAGEGLKSGVALRPSACMHRRWPKQAAEDQAGQCRQQGAKHASAG